MKAVLMSIQPKWCELIASGRKTIEIRKTRPKIETPFKCYIYMSKDAIKHLYIDEYGSWKVELIPQKIIGEFVCDMIEKAIYRIQEPKDATSWQDCYYGYDFEFVCAEAHCLSRDELYAYGDKKPLYGWHISDLVIYDEPRKLSEFCGANKRKTLTRPPQSWCYVEKRE